MKRSKAFTLIELLVVVAIIALLISILLPSLARARELSKRTVCSADTRGIGQACKIYASDNEEYWPTVVTKEVVGNDKICYVNLIGIDREEESNKTSSSVANTRNFWLLVREGAVTVKLLRCPSSTQSVDDTENLNLYYDFKGTDYVSYGYQIPFGQPDLSRPSESMDPRMCLVADRGPFMMGVGDNGEEVRSPFDYDDGAPIPRSKDEIQKFNSPNHGGAGNGEGQNVLFQDGHAEFVKTAFAGIDKDNIFSRMSFTGDTMNAGYLPNDGCEQNQTPGYQCVGPSGERDSSTDSYIYP